MTTSQACTRYVPSRSGTGVCCLLVQRHHGPYRNHSTRIVSWPQFFSRFLSPECLFGIAALHERDLSLQPESRRAGAGSPSLARSTRLSRVFQGICEHRTIDCARRRNELRCSFNGSGLSSSVLSGGRSFSRLVNTTTIDLVRAKAFNVPEQGDT